MGVTVLTVARRNLEVGLLLLAAATAWLGVIVLAAGMGSMPGTMGLGLGGFVGIWALMMAAMMLPSIAPLLSLYTRTITTRRGARLCSLATGYLLVWVAAALPAFGLAWLADRALASRPDLATPLAVAIFAACGLYQFTPVKDRCLARCRAPLGLVVRYSSFDGRTRDLRVGLHHGASCLGCCAALMALLVAFGLMNVVAMLVLAAVIVLEKTAASEALVSRAIGVASIAFAIGVVWLPKLAPGLEHVHSMGSM